MTSTTESKPEINQAFLILLSVLLAPVGGLGMDIYAPAMPHIVHDLNTTMPLVKLTLTVYLFGYGISQLLTGTLSDHIGRRKVFLWGFVLLILSNLLTANSVSITMLIIMRFVQGLVSAAGANVIKAVVADVCDNHSMNKIGAYIVTSWALGPVIGPVIGGYIQYYLGWRANFYFLAVYGLICLSLIYFYLPETLGEHETFKFKSMLNKWRTILKNKVYVGLISILSLGYAFIVMFNIVGPFFIQKTLGHSVIYYGHVAMVLGLFYFLGTITTRFLLNIYEATAIIPMAIKILMPSALILFIASFIWVNTAALLAPLCLMVFAAGMYMSPGMTVALQLFRNMVGSASSLLGTMTQIGSALLSVVAIGLTAKTQLPLAICFLFITALIAAIYKWVIARN